MVFDFNSVEQILTQLEQQPGWEKFRDYRQLLQCWQQTVNQNTAQHTRPLQINRQVLWVATSSAARAQELSFQRYALLKKLNQQLTFELKDLHFSAALWEQTQNSDRQATEHLLFQTSQRHKINKSKNNLIDLKTKEKSVDNVLEASSTVSQAKIAAQRYLITIKQNASALLVCPHCGCPTSSGEIERWNLCYLCTAQKWSKEYRPPTFPESP